MSSSSSYSYYCPQATKGGYASRPSMSTPSTSLHSSSSLYAHSDRSSRPPNYSKPPVIHNGGGKINDPNTSTSASNGSYHS